MDEAKDIDADEMDDDGWCVDCGDEQGDVLDGDEWVCRECLLVRYHKSCEEIQRLAAEVEWLTPKAMTDESVCAVLNAELHEGAADWKADDDGVGVVRSESLQDAMSNEMARAIVADLRSREKEADRD